MRTDIGLLPYCFYNFYTNNDQTCVCARQVFNTHLLTQSHGPYASPYATLRVMDIDKFVNSKRFFRCVGGGGGGKNR